MTLPRGFRSFRTLLTLLALLAPAFAGAQIGLEPVAGTPAVAAAPKTWGFWFWVAFWMPAVLLMFAFGRVLFREQWNELKTLRLLTHRLGPFFDEFDPPDLNRWVELASNNKAF